MPQRRREDVSTFAYDLSAYLANILSPLTGNSE